MFLTWFAAFDVTATPVVTKNANRTDTELETQIGLFGYRRQWSYTVEWHLDDRLVNRANWTDQTTLKSELFVSVIFSLGIALVFWWGLHMVRRDRTPGGHCIECHYDLRGTTSHQCPECGAIDSRKP